MSNAGGHGEAAGHHRTPPEEWPLNCIAIPRMAYVLKSGINPMFETFEVF
jgi:hypothetical protein